MMFISTLNYHISCIIKHKRFVALLLVFLLLSLYLVFSGCMDYKEFRAEKKDFLELEKKKVENYLNYEQYGAYGFDVLFDIAPISIYFQKPVIIKANVSTKQSYNVHKTWKGQYVLEKGKISFADWLLFAGGLAALLYGVYSFRGRKQINFFKSYRFVTYTLLSRLLAANVYTAVVLLAVFVLPHFFDIPIDGGLFFLFSLYALAYLSMIFMFGALISFIKKFPRHKELIAFLFFVVFVFLLPEIPGFFIDKKGILRVEEVELKKTQNSMDYEKKITPGLLRQMGKVPKSQLKNIQGKFAREFFESVFLKNEALDKKINEGVQDALRRYEDAAVFIPPLFFRLLNTEMSSHSVSRNTGFMDYVYRLTRGFFDFYIAKRFESDRVEADVESFIPGRENVYSYKSRLPGTFFKSLLMSVFYFSLVFLLILVLHWRWLKKWGRGRGKGSGSLLEWDDLKAGATYFYLADSPAKKTAFLTAAGNEGIEMTGFSKTTEFISSLKNCGGFIKLACRFKKIDFNVFSKKLKRIVPDSAEVDECSFNMMLMMIILEDNPGIIVLDDFFSKVGQTVEREFLEILLNKNATVIYVSSHMFSDYFHSEVREFDRNRLVLVDFKGITFN